MKLKDIYTAKMFAFVVVMLTTAIVVGDYLITNVINVVETVA